MIVDMAIIWDKGEPIAFWFGSTLVWETDKITNEIDFIDTKISLPVKEAIKFSLIFLSGMSAKRLETLILVLTAKINELKSLETDCEIQEQKQEQEEIPNEDW